MDTTKLNLLLEAIDEINRLEDNGCVLEEAVLEKFKSTTEKDVRKEADEALSGKYDSTILDDEEKLGKFLDEKSDIIMKAADITKDDIRQSKKTFRKANIVRVILGLISAITAFASCGIFDKIQMDKNNKEFEEILEKNSKKFDEFATKSRQNFEAKRAEFKKAFNAFGKVSDAATDLRNQF